MGILTGFTTIIVVIGVGWLVGRLGLLSHHNQVALSNLAFYVGNPCLVFLVVWRMDLGKALAGNLGVGVAATLLTALVAALVSRLAFRSGWAEVVVAMFCSSYVNAANIGFPIAAYVLGDIGWVAPILLVQTAILQPIGVSALDLRESRRNGRPLNAARLALLPLRNPLTIGAIVGLAANLAHVRLPQPVLSPIELIGQFSIPAMLIAFGVSMYHDASLRIGPHRTQMIVLALLKLLAMPAVAFALATALRLPAETVRAATLIAALPTAQNVFVIAQRYRAAPNLARDTVFADTVLAIPVLLALATLHP